jgi:hypothetical protein
MEPLAPVTARHRLRGVVAMSSIILRRVQPGGKAHGALYQTRRRIGASNLVSLA